MKKVLLITLLASAFYALQAQEKAPVFPDDWLGMWRGDLVISTAQGVVQKLPMRLELTPIDSTNTYHWLLVYEVGEEPDARPYTLMPADTSKGRWLIDEHNSILLDGWVLGDTFFQYFTINDSYIVLSLQWINREELLWQITSGTEKAVRESGGKTIEGEEIPLVKSLVVNNLQRAHLYRTVQEETVKE